VALKSVEAPILGDERYGGGGGSRLSARWRSAFTLAGESFDLVCPPDEGALFLLPELHAAIAEITE
jgi:tRNA pseudouridine32 synthase/23S rRNA pseudouridine746 synthase